MNPEDVEVEDDKFLSPDWKLNISTPQIAIFDFGSQFSHLIARRIRELNVFCELYSCLVTVETLRKSHSQILGCILSGGPASVFDANSPHLGADVWRFIVENEIPVLGICYGMQEMCHVFGGKVENSQQREFGLAYVEQVGKHGTEKRDLFYGIFDKVVENGEVNKVTRNKVWMSHSDKVVSLPNKFVAIAKTDSCPYAAISFDGGFEDIKSFLNFDKIVKAPGRITMYGVQFHPEVTHTSFGKQLLHNFCVNICNAEPTWKMSRVAEQLIIKLQDQLAVGTEPDGKTPKFAHVIGAVSGGVDSSVAAILLKKAIGKNFHAVLVDNGLLRLNEAQEVVNRLRDKLGINLRVVDWGKKFITELEGVVDPEKKRKTIGRLFIEAFQMEAEKIKGELGNGEDIEWLLQGTLYPDVIESVSYKGPSALIKTHHNVGGLPATMKLKLIEPLRELFKDEVRELGAALGIDEMSLQRHPFPGPGLAIRILTSVTEEYLRILKHADDILIAMLRKHQIYNEISQAFCVLLGCKSVGVMGDGRTYENVVAIRCVKTDDFMTADWYKMDFNILGEISNRIINEVKGVNRVVYDISSKPPATIEWE